VSSFLGSIGVAGATGVAALPPPVIGDKTFATPPITNYPTISCGRLSYPQTYRRWWFDQLFDSLRDPADAKHPQLTPRQQLLQPNFALVPEAAPQSAPA
jgi:hypothetical protein